MIYIKKNIQGFYIETEGQVDPEYYEGQIGETYQDFLENKWVPLSEEQILFHEEHPDAEVHEVLAMQLDQVYTPDPVETAKKNKLDQLYIYDRGENVNSFIVNDQIHAWFTPEMRSNYRNSIDAAKLLNIDNLQVFIGDTLVTLPTATAEQMLASIQLYADQCFIVTRRHEAAIQILDNLQDIEDYDFTTGYPERLNFTL